MKFERSISTALITTVVMAVSASASAQEVLNIRLGARDIGAIDPALTVTGDDETVVLQIFNSLVTPPRGTMNMELDQLQPGLAERWEISEDMTTWTFYLRPGVKWHGDYGEVSAEDVKFSYERQMDSTLGGVHGASFSDIDSIEVIDDLTVRFSLRHPNSFFHASALTPGFGRFIVSKAAVEALGDDFRYAPIGSGPYEFSEYRPQEMVILRAFDDYFGGRPEIDELRMRYIPDNNAATIAFIGDELDVSSGERTPQWVTQMEQARPDANLITMLPGSLQFLHFNMKVEPLDNPLVRKAIGHAIDREAWADYYDILSGPLTAIVPEEFFGALPYDQIPVELRYSFDPDLARELLAEAGYPDGFQIQALSSERDDYLTAMLMVQDMVRDVGIDIDLRVVDHATYHANIRDDMGTIVMLSTAIAPTAPAVINEFLHSSAAVGQESALRNFSHYGNLGGSVDDLVEQAVSETDADLQRELLYEAQLQILEDIPVFPLQTAPLLSVMQGDIDLGYEPISGFGQHEFGTARRVRD